MAYKITISKIETVTKIKRGEYCVVNERLITQAEIDEANYHDKQTLLSDKGFPMKREYGYPGNVEYTENVDTKVFEQTVDALDVKAVIGAINK